MPSGVPEHGGAGRGDDALDVDERLRGEGGGEAHHPWADAGAVVSTSVDHALHRVHALAQHDEGQPAAVGGDRPGGPAEQHGSAVGTARWSGEEGAEERRGFGSAAGPARIRQGQSGGTARTARIRRGRRGPAAGDGAATYDAGVGGGDGGEVGGRGRGYGA